jgi:putative transposase
VTSVTVSIRQTRYTGFMTKGLKRYQQSGSFHFVTFSCYRRRPYLASPHARSFVEETLEQVRRSYSFLVCGYVIMPEHVHLLVSEPECGTLRAALQLFKQTAARKLRPGIATPFWYARYYDFNVWTDRKRIEKLRYIHRNPVKRGLVAKPEDWRWSSFVHYATGIEGTVEIASEWTAQRQARKGIGPPRFSQPTSS